MIAACLSPAVAYLWEPFSILHRPGICDARFPDWFPYVCGENGSRYRRSIEDMLVFRYKAVAELRSLRSPKDAARMARDWARFSRFRREGARPLLKDPIAVFSAGWLADTFDMDVIVLIRHPAAFAHSVKSRNLRHPFDHFLRQPLMMRDVLSPFDEEIRRFAAREQPLIDQAILLWNLIHSAILGYRGGYNDWQFRRLEDIARDPLSEFEATYRCLGLTFDGRVRRTIAAHSEASNPEETADPASHRRDSRASIVTWKARLSPDEIDRVRAGTEGIWREFYSDGDW